MDVALRRRYGFAPRPAHRVRGRAPARPADGGDGDAHARILEAEIERPRVGPMRDIVATIQPEQDVIVRADCSATLVRAGRAGHRQDGGRPAPRGVPALRAPRPARRRGVLVVGPNTAFLRYIRDVLPALGEVDVRQTTIEELVGDHAAGPRRTEPRRRRDAQGRRPDGRGAAPGAVGHVGDRRPRTLVVAARLRRRWRVPALRGRRSCVAELRARDVRYGAGAGDAAAAARRTAVLVQMEAAGDSPDDRVQDAVARSKPVKATSTRCGRRSTRRRLVCGCSPTPSLLAERGRRDPRPATSRRCCSGRSAPRGAKLGTVDARRRRAARRGRRPGRPHAVARPRRASTRRRTSRRCSCARSAAAARRARATVLGDLAQAHHAVGDRRLGRGPRATSASRTRTSRS